MSKQEITRVDYWNPSMNIDFEIVDLQLFFSTRPRKAIEKDYRLNFWVILYIIEGEGHHWIDFVPYPYKKGDIIFIQKNQVHRAEVNKDVKGYVIHINEPFFYKINSLDSEMFLEFVDRAYGKQVINFDTSKDQMNRTLIELIYQTYNKGGRSVDQDFLASLFQSFILSLKTTKPLEKGHYARSDFENYKQFRQLVETHFREIRSVEAYADMMHLSKKTVNQATRNVAGLSAKSFISERVVLEIKRYLSQGDLLSYEIAEYLGFDEAANMTRFFKRYTGMSPKAFRESLE